MLKQTLLHMLFIGAVVFAASFLKKDATDLNNAVVQRHEIAMDEEHYPYNVNTPQVTDTLSFKRK